MRFVRYGLTLMAAVSGCTDAEPGPGDRDSDAAAPLEDSFNSISLIQNVTEFSLMPLASNNVPGVRVCQTEPLRCVQTNEYGDWMMSGLEPEREILLTYEKAGYTTALFPIVTPVFSAHIRAISLVAEGPDDPNAQANRARAAVGLAPLEYSDQLGSLSFTAVMPDGTYIDNSVRVQLQPDSGIEPIYYLDKDYEISAVIPDGRVATFGHFPNVPPGDYELEYTIDDGECFRVPSDWSAWPAKDGRTNVTRVPVRANTTTWATAQVCTRDRARP